MFKYMFFLFFISCSILRTEKKSEFTLNSLQIENKDLLYIIDDFLMHEQKCDYFSSKLLFNIHIQKLGGKYIFQIESIGEKIMRNNYYGVIDYKSHLFFVSGENYFKDFFKKEGNRKIDNSLIINTKELNNNIITVFEDDSFNIWVYYFENEKFIIKDKFSDCD